MHLFNKSSDDSDSITDSDEELISHEMELFQPFLVEKLTIFLDLDSTLIYATSQTDDYTFGFTIGDRDFHIIVRPHADQFLDFLCDIADVYVYTSAQETYAKHIVTYFNTPRKRIINFFSQKNLDSNKKKQIDILHTRRERTILIDDQKDVCSHEQCCWPIEPFEGDKNDNELMKMKTQLSSFFKSSSKENFQAENQPLYYT